MPRDYRIYLDDIVEAIERIQRYTTGLPQEAIAANQEKVDAIVRNLEIIGEAAKQVPESVRSAHPEIEWRKVSGLRDILIHQYFGIDVGIVLDVVRNKLPVLKQQIKDILKS